jgi:hypothetical protein
MLFHQFGENFLISSSGNVSNGATDSLLHRVTSI